MRFLTLPPLVALLLLVFLWFILLVILLWFALRPRRLEDADITDTNTKDKEVNATAKRKRSPPKDDPPTPSRRPVVVRKATPKDAAQDDTFDGFNHPANRRDDFDF